MELRVGNKRLCVILCVMLQSLTSSPSRAAEWSMEPSVDLRGEYDSNVNFTSDPHPSVWALKFSPDVKFSGATEALNVTGRIRVTVNRYFGENGLDSTDYITSLQSSYKTERNLLGLNVEAVRDSTLLSELSETGVVNERRQRTRVTANPTWTRSLTEVTSLTASYRYSDVRYADTAGTSLIDYHEHSATVGLQSNLSERDIVSGTLYYDLFETDPAAFRASTYGIQVGYDRPFSETLHGFLAVGARQTRGTVACEGPGSCTGNVIPPTSSQSATSTDTGYIFTATLDKKWETATISGRASRELTPSGVGALFETDRIGVNWTQQWSPTVSSSVDGAAYRSRQVGDLVAGINDSRYYTTEPKVIWKFTEWWTLTGGYSYSHVRHENPPDQSSPARPASRNVWYLMITYAWPKLSVSH